MNSHWFFFVSVVFGAWFVTHIESSFNTIVEDAENPVSIKSRSARVSFDSSTNNKTVTTLSDEIPEYRYIGRHAFTPASRPQAIARQPYGWRVTTTKIPSLTTARSWYTTKKYGWVITTTPKNFHTTKNLTTHSRHSTKRPKNDVGWVITTTSKNFHTNKNSTNGFGWNTSLFTTPKTIFTTKSHPILSERKTTNAPFNYTNGGGWSIQTTTPRPFSTTIQSGWATTTSPTITTTSRSNFGWFATISRASPIRPTPTPITMKKKSKTNEQITTTRRPSTRKPIHKISTTQNPFGGYGRRNDTSSNVGEWKKITLLNSQTPPQPYSYPYPRDNNQLSQWNSNKNNPIYVQTLHVIPQNNSKHIV